MMINIIKKVFLNTSEVKNMTKTMINIIKTVFLNTSEVKNMIKTMINIIKKVFRIIKMMRRSIKMRFHFVEKIGCGIAHPKQHCQKIFPKVKATFGNVYIYSNFKRENLPKK